MIIFLTATVTLLTCALAALWLHVWRPDTRRARVRQRAIVQTRNGTSWSGVVWEHDRSGLVLRDAQAHDADPSGGHVALDGEVWIPAEQVDFLQYPG